MAQQHIEWLKEQLQQVKQKIGEQEMKIDDAIKNGKAEKLINCYKERKDRLVNEDKDLRQMLSVLLAQLASPAGSRQPDESAKVCKQLIQPPLPLPPDIGELKSVLLSDLTAKLPTDPSVLASLSPSVSCHFQPASGSLSRCISTAVEYTPKLGGEPFTLIAVQNIVIAVLIKLDELLSPFSRTGLYIQRDGADSDALMTLESAGGGRLRSAGQLRKSDGIGLLAKWEEKGAGHPLQDAKQDLQRRTALWSPLYYGDLSYLVCFAAAGAYFQFCAIQRGCISYTTEIGPEFNMTLVNDRAWLVLATVNLYRVLAAVNASLPRYVLPAGKDLVCNHPRGYQRVMYFRTDRLTVKKRITPWSAYHDGWGVEFQTLQRVYERTAKSSGLVHVARGGDGLRLEADKYTVELTPVGLQPADARPSTEQQAASAAHGFLHGLDAIHKNGACDLTKTGYFLLDLELCAEIDKEPGFNLRSWDSDTLVRGRYTAASDLHSLGRMLQELYAIIVSEEGRSFLAELRRPAKEQQQSAEQLLSRAWIKCEGVHCRAAGAHPNDM
ncbi:g4211 [Coccomyxa elongata]